MKKLKRKNIIILIILFVILFIILGVCISLLKEQQEKRKQQELLEQKKQQVVQYTKISDFKSIEEVLIYLDSEFISQKDSDEENLDFIVLAKLKYDLNLNNKNYYENLIQYSAAACNYKNFYIIDEENDIRVLVLCNNSQSVSSYYINNEKFYFDKLENKENINNTNKPKTIEIKNVCNILEKIINANWVTTDIDIGSKESIYKGYDIYFDEGLEIKKVNRKVFNIVFTDKYKETIVENLKIDSSRDEVKENLGEPEFENSKCIGYKTDKFYIFFSEKQISIYPVQTYSSDEIINIINEYEESNDFQTYMNKLRAEWEDYDIFKNTDNNVILQYTLKGIVFNYNNTNKQGIVLYNNYVGKVDDEDTLQNVIENKTTLPDNMYYINEDLVFEEEVNRILALDDYSDKDNFSSDNVLNISKKFKAYTDIETNRFCFISINKENPNSQLREGFDYGIWYDDSKFIYSIKQKGIYMYNAEERVYSTIKEGTDEFKITKIEDNQLYYDENVIDL
jgi:hypothetical protein